MSHTLIDIYNNILKYNENEITIVMDENRKPWFSAINIAKMLEYINTRKAIIKNVSSKNKQILDEIVDDTKEIKTNAQPHSVFINEFGLYELITNSNQKKAREFKKWLYEEVLPSIREFGEYSLSEKQKKDIEKLKEKLNEVKTRAKILENNQKKNKFVSGGYVYVIRPINGDKNLVKLGKTEDIKKRINTYNTSVPDNMEILYTLKVDDPIAVEHCMKALMHGYIYIVKIKNIMNVR